MCTCILCRCWCGTGLDLKVLGMLSSLVDTALDKNKLKLYFTGEVHVYGWESSAWQPIWVVVQHVQ